jgi:hypothetical protein
MMLACQRSLRKDLAGNKYRLLLLLCRCSNLIVCYTLVDYSRVTIVNHKPVVIAC